MSRIVQFAEFGPPPVLHVVDQPESHPGGGQVRVAVKAAGLNVIGSAPFRSLSEHVVVDAGTPARKPSGLSWEVAAGIPVAGTTAYNSVNSLQLGPDDVVLVSAAAGGVGVFAAQLAKRTGATVIGTASEANHEYLKSLGVIPVSYGSGLVDRIRQVAPQGITAVLENHGSEAIEAGLALGVPPTRINTVAGSAATYGIGGAGGTPEDPAIVGAVAALIDSGDVVVPIEGVYAIDDVVAAYERLDQGHLRGKVILRIHE
jgi:NADPH:quinone reductase-like Zn-dependent oxidoreductase